MRASGMNMAMLVAVSLLGLAVLCLLAASAATAQAPRGGNAQRAVPHAREQGSQLAGSPAGACNTYSYTVSPGVIDTATTMILSCGRCIANVSLPFSFAFYGQTYSSVNVESQGNVQLATSDTSYPTCPFPFAQLGPAMLPYWSQFDTYWHGTPDPCEQNYGIPCGVYTSVTGSAPYRVFNIQWLGVLTGSNHETVNFEVRLHETTNVIDFVYGLGIKSGELSAVGVQDGQGSFISYACHTNQTFDFIKIEWTPSTGPCPTNTPTPTPTPTYTHTATPMHSPTPLATSTSTAIGTLTPLPIATATFTTTPRPTGSPTPAATGTACTLRFVDVPPGSTFYPFVRCLVCHGIISGYPDGTFRPNNNVTRGQLSKIVSNAAGLNDPQTLQAFQDVPPGSTFFDYIGRLASRGYINGYPCGNPEPCVPPNNLPYFRPGANATRGQISKIVSNAAGFNDPPGTRIFQDVPPGSTFYDYVQRLASRDVMSGYPCGGPGEPCIPPANLPYFRPGQNATRGQTSKIVANTFLPDCAAFRP